MHSRYRSAPACSTIEPPSNPLGLATPVAEIRDVDRFVPDDARRRAAQRGGEARAIAFLRRFTVFNTDQCDGLPKETPSFKSPAISFPHGASHRHELVGACYGAPSQLGITNTGVPCCSRAHRERAPILCILLHEICCVLALSRSACPLCPQIRRCSFPRVRGATLPSSRNSRSDSSVRAPNKASTSMDM